MCKELIGGVEEHLGIVAENVELFGDGRGLVDEDEELRELEANEGNGGVVLELGEKGGKT